MAVQIPDPSARLALDDGRPSQTWYGILSRLARLLNDTEATVGDASSGLESKLSQGRHTIWVPAAAMVPGATTGPTSTYTEMASGNRLQTLDFDQSTFETAFFQIAMPKSWNKGSLAWQPYWTAASGSGGVSWAITGVAMSNDDTLDVSFTSQSTVEDTFIAANDLHVGAEGAGFTPGGTPANDDIICFRVRRDPGQTADTLTADAKLIGIKLFYVLNAGNDA